MNELKQLLATVELPDLADKSRAGVLSQAAIDKKLRESLPANFDEARINLIRALFFIWHDHLETAHTISQNIQTADGSYLHGIVHRREPDYDNAAYWFRRVGKYRGNKRIAEQVKNLLSGKFSWEQKLVVGDEWDPLEFVHVCERWAQVDSADAQLLREIQATELRALLELFLEI